MNLSGRSESVSFTLGDDSLETLEKEPHKFLGSTITFENKQKDIFQVVFSYFKERLDRIDDLKVREEFKVRIFQQYLLPSSRFMLTIHQLTTTNLKKLDALVTKFLKKWLGLPRCATPAILHVPQLFEMKTISQLYQECQNNAYISSRMKGDPKVNEVLDSRLQRESSWVKKKSSIVQSEIEMKKVLNHQDDEEKNLTIVKKKVNTNLNDEMKEHWMSRMKDLVVQGDFISSVNEMDADFNFKSILYELPRNVLKFLANSAIDTLPTNVNLKRWNKRNSPDCQLCGNKETMLHVFNNCKTMLDQGRYSWRHDSILNQLYDFIKPPNSDSNFEVYCDLPGKKTGISTVPTDIVITNQRPDIVIVNRDSNDIILIELTIPFYTNIENAHERKKDRYEQLVNDINNSNYDSKLYTKLEAMV